MSLLRASIVLFFVLVPWHASALEAEAFWRTFRTQNALFSQDIVASPAEAISPASGSTDSLTLSELFSKGVSGVFHQDTDGLVVLVLDRSIRLNDQKPQLRQFFLDADAIVGAVVPTAPAANRLMAIVGRARATSTDQMPPLDVFLRALVTNVNESSVAQSATC